MNADEWETIALLLHRGFKWQEPFGETHEFTYRTLLDGIEAEQIANVLRALVAKGQVFGPTPGEIVNLIRRDSSVPTGPEMLALLYDKGGVFKEQVRKRDFPEDYELPAGHGAVDSRMLSIATDNARMRRAAELHPKLAAFVQREGVARLAAARTDDPEWGWKHREDLIAKWDAFLEATEGRELASIASGGRTGMRQLDPMAALGVPAGQRQIVRGNS